jgi:hypothetical protein
MTLIATNLYRLLKPFVSQHNIHWLTNEGEEPTLALPMTPRVLLGAYFAKDSQNTSSLDLENVFWVQQKEITKQTFGRCNLQTRNKKEATELRVNIDTAKAWAKADGFVTEGFDLRSK